MVLFLYKSWMNSFHGIKNLTEIFSAQQMTFQFDPKRSFRNQISNGSLYTIPIDFNFFFLKKELLIIRFPLRFEYSIKYQQF